MKTNYLFLFIKYITPTWYYNLKSSSKIPYWVDYRLLNEDDRRLIGYDKHYSSEYASLLDAAYQAWHKGVVIFDESKVLNIEENRELKISDQYRFIRKYYSSVWSIYILFIRLLSLKNPLLEIGGFLKNISTKKVYLYSEYNRWNKLQSFNSKLVERKPLVSVIIPTLNRYKYLDDVLNDLEKQDYKNFEVIVCDQSEPVDEKFYNNRDLDLKLIKQKEKALWLARNRSVKESRGEYILLFDDDSRVDSNWISSHIKCIDFFGVDISSGVSLSTVGGKIPVNYSFYRWSDQIDTGNVMIHRDVFNRVGLFDRQFEKQRMGDGEYGLRCYIKGVKNISNPDAKRIHLKVSTGGLRQMGSWDAFRSKKIFAPKPVPSVLYFIRKYFGKGNAFRMLFISVPTSVIPYKYKGKNNLLLIVVPLFLLMFPIILIQVLRSWKLSSRMLKEGDKIEYLD